MSRTDYGGLGFQDNMDGKITGALRPSYVQAH
jgi:hypothetical protein